MAFLNIAPTGTVLPFAGSTAPEGWLICQATAVSRTTYAALFAVIGTTYGTGDGSTTFNLPDMRGVFPRGSGTNGTGNYGGATGHTPAGGSLANKGRQLTRNNGLTATAGTTTVSGNTGNVSNDHSHYAGQLSGQVSPGAITSPGSGWNCVNSGTRDSSHTTSGITSNHVHGWSGTTSAAAISIGAGDTETTPAFLALNYIIKL